jgi:hypothetical protein
MSTGVRWEVGFIGLFTVTYWESISVNDFCLRVIKLVSELFFSLISRMTVKRRTVESLKGLSLDIVFI